MKHITILLFFFYLTFNVSSQTKLIEEDIRKYDIKIPTSGPNLKNFRHFYLDYAFAVTQTKGEGADINFGKTHIFTIGWRYKRKLSNFFSYGFDFNYNNLVFNLKQNSKKIVPNNITHTKEKIKLNNAGGEFFLRTNIGRRGNIVGKFLDIGAFVNWSIITKHYFEDDTDSKTNGYNAGKTEVVYKDLNYVEEFQYGIKARIGVNRWVVSAKYRLSDVLTDKFRTSTVNIELPRLFIGLQIGLHR